MGLHVLLQRLVFLIFTYFVLRWELQ